MRFLVCIIFSIYLNTGYTQLTGITPVFQTGHTSKINTVKIHPNNKHLISASDDGILVVWNLILGLQQQSIVAHQNGLNDFDFLTDSTLVSVGNNGKCKIWSFPELILITEYSPIEKAIYSVAKINDSLIVLGNQSLYILNIKQNKLKTIPYFSRGIFTSISYDPTLNEIAISGPKDNIVVALSFQNNIETTNILLGNAKKVKFTYPYLMQANVNGIFRYYDYRTKKRHTYSLNNDANYVTDMDYCKKEFALSTSYGHVLIINSKNHKINQRLIVNGTELTSIDYSNNKAWLAVGGVNGQIYIYDAKS